MKITDFDKFVGIRLGYYAIVLAIFAIILNSQDLINEISFDINNLIRGMMVFMIIVIISHNIITNAQRERLIYYRFKLKCIDKIIDKKENKNAM